MKYAIRTAALALVAAALPLPAAAGGGYWTYTYQNVQVVAADSKARAKEMAHNLHRLDLALQSTLGTRPDVWRAPIRIYALTRTDFEMLGNTKTQTGLSSMTFPSVGATEILINSEAAARAGFFDVYAGFTGALLNDGYSFRYPAWYRRGLQQVFGASSVTRQQVTIGGIVADRVRPILNGWIPLNYLFAIHFGDPQLSSQEFLWRYDAECWLVVHQIFMEHQYRDNFDRYLSKLEAGEDAPQAFAESFDVDYATLDKEMQDALARGVYRVIKVKIPDDPDAAEPTRLSDPEAKGRLAAFAANHPSDAESTVRLANEALAADPKNEQAMLALTFIAWRRHDLPVMAQEAGRLCALDPLSQSGNAACGKVYSALLYQGGAKNAQVGLDEAALAERARRFYGAAVRLDADDVASWSGMAELLAKTHDVANAKAFLPDAKHAWAMHARNEDLARSLAWLCASLGDFDTAVKFATVWQKNARTDASAANADNYLSRLKSSNARHALSDAGAAEAAPQGAQ